MAQVQPSLSLEDDAIDKKLVWLHLAEHQWPFDAGSIALDLNFNVNEKFQLLLQTMEDKGQLRLVGTLSGIRLYEANHIGDVRAWLWALTEIDWFYVMQKIKKETASRRLREFATKHRHELSQLLRAWEAEDRGEDSASM